MIVSTLCRRLLPLTVGVIAVLVPSAARAIEDEWSLGAGAVVASIPTEESGIVGFGVAALCRYAVTDTIAVGISGQYTMHVPTPTSGAQTTAADGGAAEDIAQLFVPRLGVQYAIDVIDLVPYIVLDAAAYLGDTSALGGEDWMNGFGLVGGVGLDYRGWRAWSVGLEVDYHALLSDISNYPVIVGATIMLAWHSDPF